MKETAVLVDELEILSDADGGPVGPVRPPIRSHWNLVAPVTVYSTHSNAAPATLAMNPRYVSRTNRQLFIGFTHDYSKQATVVNWGEDSYSVSINHLFVMTDPDIFSSGISDDDYGTSIPYILFASPARGTFVILVGETEDEHVQYPEGTDSTTETIP